MATVFVQLGADTWRELLVCTIRMRRCRER